MASMVPLISSDVAGPLGAIHLPRFWSKVLLSAKGMLHEEYDECGTGFDQMTLDGLKLDREATLSYLRNSLPTYREFEAWVLTQRGGTISSAEIEAHNQAIRDFIHPDEDRKPILSFYGIEDDGSILDAVNLNNLDDWTEFHRQLTNS